MHRDPENGARASDHASSESAEAEAGWLQLALGIGRPAGFSF